MNVHTKVSIFVVACCVTGTTGALAQDPEPAGVKPNILFVIDTSGSMEYKTEYDTFDDRYPECHPGNPNLVNEKSRWIDVLEVLTGEIPDAKYSCEAVDRTTNNFKTEFALDGIQSPDANYRNPYHRPISNNCLWTPDRTTTTTNAFSWIPPVQAVYPLSLASVAGCISTTCCTFEQTGGFIDNFGDLVRFGLMTFDPLPDFGRGYNVSTFAPEYSSGAVGAWSYYDGGSYAEGRPVGCPTKQALEVGVRNAAAPASEGKMVYFGASDSDVTVDGQRHDRIKKVLRATRPFGATPLNGALSDVRYFLWEEDAPDPLNASLKLSPRYDDLVECGCRKQHIILITDGEPNLDMRPDCESTALAPNGECPFEDTPVTILKNLYNQESDADKQTCVTPSTGKLKWRVPTHVVGFATDTYDLGDGNGERDCANLDTDQPTWRNAGGICDTSLNEDLRICCTLHELADAGSGGDEEPYIAPSAAELEAALASIVSGLAQTSASATRPVRSPGIGRAQEKDEQIAFRVLTSYETQTGTSGLWRGNIERMRWLCEDGEPVEQEKDLSKGDDFSYNVEKNAGSRMFYSVVPAAGSSGTYFPEGTIRPFLGSNPNDGLGTTTTVTEARGELATFVSGVAAGALKLTSANYTTDPACTLDNPSSSANSCRDRVLNWTLGDTDGQGRDRCVSYGDRENCSLIGHVMHSAPVIVDRPKAFVEDETYTTFATENQGRMMMMYVSSNDGMLHGFAVSPNDPSAPTDEHIITDTFNNELYAFLPPFVLAQLKNQYPNIPAKLLDSTAVVRDVVASTPGHTSAYGYTLERDLNATLQKSNTWRTILVQGFGGAQSGYFALDVTRAEQPTSASAGPRFLWQISTTDSGSPMFGKGGTPLITTLNVSGKEVAVAVLPGGSGGSPTGTAARKDPDLASNVFTNTYYDSSLTFGSISPPRPPRKTINQYGASDAAARSLTIVRLDNGQILRTFWHTAPTELNAVKGNAVSYIDSPITGVPAAFPSGTGMVADRIFVGDQDGALWRVDVSDPDPATWTMKLFHDSYGGKAAGDGKPITIAPVLSVNEAGNITIAYATGAQDLSGGNGNIQYIYSLTEAEKGATVAATFYAKVNWFQELTTGEHILGPMSLNNEVLYFSTLDPASGNVCDKYPSNIWGVDYLDPADTNDISKGGVARFPSGSSYVQFVNAQSLTTGSDSIGPVFGVSVEYAPTCTAAPEVEDLEYLAGSRTAVTQPSASNLQLVFQTGTAKGSQAGLKFTTGFEAVTLPQPRVPSTLLSWAAILD